MIFNKKIFFFVVLLVFFLISIFFWPTYKNFLFQSQVVFLNIGQGDATLFKLPNQQVVLVDGGPDNLILRRLGEELPFYVKKIDYIFISHWHDDHVVGLIEVMRRFQVRVLLYASDLEISNVGKILLEEARLQNIKIFSIQQSGTINVSSSCQLSFVNPFLLNIKNNDNNSLIIKLGCNNRTFLLSGDNEKGVEEGLIKSNLNLKTDIFKASHHGSKTSNQKYFLEKIQPQFIVISCGLDNKFNHPSAEVIKNVQELNIKILRTDKQGSIKFPLD